MAKTRKKVKSAGVITEIFDVRKLSPKENYLLWCIEEELFANIYAVKVETLILWRSLGMPATVVRNNTGKLVYFYNYFDAQDWVNTNIDTIWLKTPGRLLTQQIGDYIVVSKTDNRQIIFPKDQDLRRMVLERLNQTRQKGTQQNNG